MRPRHGARGMGRRVAGLALLSLAFGGVGFGCGDTEEAQPTAQPTAQDVARAERAARQELPKIPLWQGTRFEGVLVGDDKVCVNRTLVKANADLVGIAELTSHVVVDLSDMSVGAPQDGSCAGGGPNVTGRAKRFYMQMDDLAVRVDDAIAGIESGNKSAILRLAVLDRVVKERNDRWTLSTGESWEGANLVDSAVSAALVAARNGDVAGVVKQRDELLAARRQLAEDATK